MSGYTCKCGMHTYTGHLLMVEGGYPGHAYTGTPPWCLESTVPDVAEDEA